MLGWAFDNSLFLSCLGDAHARTRARICTHTHPTHTKNFADFLFLLIKAEVIENKTTNFRKNQIKKKSKGRRVSGGSQTSSVSNSRVQSEFRACVCARVHVGGRYVFVFDFSPCVFKLGSSSSPPPVLLQASFPFQGLPTQ